MTRIALFLYVLAILAGILLQAFGPDDEPLPGDTPTMNVCETCGQTLTTPAGAGAMAPRWVIAREWIGPRGRSIRTVRVASAPTREEAEHLANGLAEDHPGTCYSVAPESL